MIAKLSRRAPKALRLIWYQTPAKAQRINCTGFTCAVDETDLPYVPTIVPISLVNGEFDMLPPTAEQAASLELRAYSVGVRLVNGAGVGVEAMRFTLGVE